MEFCGLGEGEDSSVGRRIEEVSVGFGAGSGGFAWYRDRVGVPPGQGVYRERIL